MRVIYALWLRELKRYFRSHGHIISGLGQSLIQILAFGFGFGQVFQADDRGGYIQFLAPGIIATAIMSYATSSGISILLDRQGGFLREALVAPVPRLQLMLGATLGGATVAVVQGLFVLIVCLTIGFRPTSSLLAFPLTVAFMTMIAVSFCALGSTIGSLFENARSFSAVMNFVLTPLFFFSGALFPMAEVSEPMRVVIAYNPFSYGVDGLRALMTGVSSFGLLMDWCILLIVMGLFISAGTYLFARMQL